MNKMSKIIAIHGAGMNGGIFGGMAPLLTALPFQALTLPGHSTRLKDVLIPDIAGMADFLRARIEGDAPKSVILAGHSMGGLVAIAAAGHPAVAGVIVMGCAAKMPVHQDLLGMAKADPRKAAALVCKWGLDAANSLAPALAEALLDMMEQVPEGALYNDLFACDAAPLAVMPQDVPFLCLIGEQDKMVKPQDSVALAESVGGTFAFLENCGHMMPFEKAADCAREISDFARDVAAR